MEVRLSPLAMETRLCCILMETEATMIQRATIIRTQTPHQQLTHPLIVLVKVVVVVVEAALHLTLLKVFRLLTLP